ncbi:MAG: VacJ family lipoprotein [Exilibacterium sp.]
MGILHKTILPLVLAGLFSTEGVAEENPDPWEGFNRAMFSFNDHMDRYLLKPAAKGYRAMTPDPVETSINTAFNNLSEVRNIVNDVLQWKWQQAGNDTGRFLINSTVGVVGLFDAAGYMGLRQGEGEDFGQTLAVWGVGRGPFLVLPLFGPSTLRDAVAFPVDTYSNPSVYINDVASRNTLKAFELLNTRAQLLETEELISGDRYAFLRDAYLQHREYLVNDGEVEDDFGGDFDDFDYE